MSAEEIATLVNDAAPYVTAALGAYGGAVLSKVRDDAAGATVGIGRRLLQRIFGRNVEGESLPEPLATLAADLTDLDALGAVRLAIRSALAADDAMLAGVRLILAEAASSPVTQQIHAARDAYVAGRDMTVNLRDI